MRVLIADDHAFTLAGLQHRLDGDPRFDVVATAAGAIETIRDARKCKPDLAIVDYSMPDGNGLEVLVELRRWSPETAVVILTGAKTPTYPVRCSTPGRVACCAKPARPTTSATP